MTGQVGCGNACGASWCCRHWLSWIDDDPEAIQLALCRGARVYRVKQVSRSLLVSLPAACRHLTQTGMCDRQDTKPRFCQQFPMRIGGGLMALPKRCPYLGQSDQFVALEDMREVTMADVVDMLARRGTVDQNKEDAHVPNSGD